ncbi:MAG TPA: MFS transporter [Candidatus Bilamarchaeum sp.]|nr:MFS transporter [Candidatus Bilamarchaeum sp.]
MFPQGNDSGPLNRLLAINMLYTFVVSAMAVLVPLYLLEQNVDIALIGLILSLGPLSFMVIRIFLASVADEIGTRAISVLYAASNVAAMGFYLFFVSPAGFALATLSEGIRASGFWAITRTEVLSVNNSDPGKALARFSNMRQLADGAGRVAVALLLAYLAFSGTLAFFLVVSLLLLALVAGNRKGKEKALHIGKSNTDKIFRKRPRTFWYAAILQALVWLTYNTATGFLLPVYLNSSLEFSYQDTGLLMALLSIVTALFAIAFFRLGMSKRTLLLISLLQVPALLALPFFGKDVLLPLLLIAVATGPASIVAEYILVDQVFRSKNVSTDIGVLYAPLKVCEFAFLSLGGIVIANYGFFPLFAVLGLSTFLFVVLGRNALSPEPAH